MFVVIRNEGIIQQSSLKAASHYISPLVSYTDGCNIMMDGWLATYHGWMIKKKKEFHSLEKAALKLTWADWKYAVTLFPFLISHCKPFQLSFI